MALLYEYDPSVPDYDTDEISPQVMKETYVNADGTPNWSNVGQAAIGAATLGLPLSRLAIGGANALKFANVSSKALPQVSRYEAQQAVRQAMGLPAMSERAAGVVSDQFGRALNNLNAQAHRLGIQSDMRMLGNALERVPVAKNGVNWKAIGTGALGASGALAASGSQWNNVNTPNVELPTQQTPQTVITNDTLKLPPNSYKDVNQSFEPDKLPDQQIREVLTKENPYLPNNANTNVKTSEYGLNGDTPNSNWSIRRNYRNGGSIAEDYNNPLNETVRGRTKNGGRSDFKYYHSLGEGIRGNWGLLQRYQDQHGLNDIRSISAKWSGLSGKKLDEYVGVVAKRSGLDPSQKLDLHNPEIASKLMYGMAYMESHQNAKKNLSPERIFSAMTGGQPRTIEQAPVSLPPQQSVQQSKQPSGSWLPDISSIPAVSNNYAINPLKSRIGQMILNDVFKNRQNGTW